MGIMNIGFLLGAVKIFWNYIVMIELYDHMKPAELYTL